jgi:hypothetical protein
MHFLRSVIEHHRRGGDSEAIEQLYRMEEDQSVDESGALDCEPTLRPRLVHSGNRDAASTVPYRQKKKKKKKTLH